MTEVPPAVQAADRVGRVLRYCLECGLPREFCEFGPSPSKCVLAPEPVLPASPGEAKEDDKEDDDDQVVDGDQDGEVEDAPAPAAAAKGKGGDVLIYKATRGRKKAVTIVEGLELHGLKLKDVVKKFKSKFACGSTVSEKEDGSGAPMVIVQGDVQYDMPDFLVSAFKIPEDSIFNYEPKSRKKTPVF